MKTSDTTDKIFPALFKATSTIGNIGKGKTNPHFKSKYVSLDILLNETRPALIESGLFVLQSPSREETSVTVETRIIHAESGQWVSVSLSTPIDKQNAQGVGSAVTYMRRYGLFALLGVAETDDDGNDAVKRAKKEPGNRAANWANKQKTNLNLLEKPGELDNWETVNEALREDLKTKAPDVSKDLEELVIKTRKRVGETEYDGSSD